MMSWLLYLIKTERNLRLCLALKMLMLVVIIGRVLIPLGMVNLIRIILKFSLWNGTAREEPVVELSRPMSGVYIADNEKREANDNSLSFVVLEPKQS